MVDRIVVRRLWWQVHKWVALALMIVLIPLGLSGIVLTWDDAIDHLLEPQRYAVSGAATLPPSAYAAAARRAVPGGLVAMVRYPEGDGPVVANVLRAPKGVATVPGGRRGPGGRQPRSTVWLDPATARILDVARGNDSLVAVAHVFHGSLLVPGPGRALVGLLGVAMFVLAASGIWVWWPQAGPWRRALRWRRGDARTDTNLHHSVGFWIALPLAAQAFTGAWIAWPQMLALVGIEGARGPAGPRGAPPIADTRLDADGALRIATTSATDAVRAIAWPTAPQGRWRVTIADAGASRDIEIDDRTAIAIPAKRRGGDLSATVRHLHDGSIAGAAWRVMMVPLGLAPTVLGITGLLMWWRDRGRRRRSARRMAAGTVHVAA